MFTPIFGIIVVLIIVAWAGLYWRLDPDTRRIRGFPFSELAVNRRILTMASFRAQYAFYVTIVRTWVPIYRETGRVSRGL
ncbi:MAG: hypothetical protein ACI9K3_000303 [Halovenus sp.]